MDCCCLPPERVELTVSSKKETNGRVKMGQKSQNGPRVKMRCCCLLPERVELIVHSKERNKWQGQNGPKESKWAKSQDAMLLFTP